jgi:hypothetical protein
MAGNGYWEWDNSPEIINKKCNQCGQAMRYDRAAAVLYKSNSYHSYCLLDFLTAYHTNHENVVTSTDCGQWGLIP